MAETTVNRYQRKEDLDRDLELDYLLLSVHPSPHPPSRCSLSHTHARMEKKVAASFSAGESPMAKLVGHRKTKILFSSYIFTKLPLQTFLQGRMFKQQKEIKPKGSALPPSL